MTFSIVARSDDGESWGVAVASRFLAVGSVVPAAVAGIGALATQADANVAWKGLALAHLDEGATAPVALDRLLEEDDAPTHRQIGIVDVDGTASAHTGDDCLPWAGDLVGRGVRLQGNVLTGPEVLWAMKESWDGSADEPDLGPAAAGRAARPATGPAATAGVASRRRCWWSGRRPGTAASTTSRSTCGSTTTPTRAASSPGCWS